MEQKELHLRLKKLRKDCKLTQEQMAKYLGVDQTLKHSSRKQNRNEYSIYE